MMPEGKLVTWNDYMIIRLLRRWTTLKATGEDMLAGMLDLADPMGASRLLAAAADALFALTEQALERGIRTGSFCCLSLSADESAILLLIATVSRPTCSGDLEMPSGLSGALSWSALRVSELASGPTARSYPNAQEPFSPAPLLPIGHLGGLDEGYFNVS